MAQLMDTIKQRLGIGRTRPGPKVLPRSRFETVLALERTRADRGDSPFSVVVFESDGDWDDSQGAQRYQASWENELSRFLFGRLRSIDCAGRHDEKRIAVLLPLTDSDGATALAEETSRGVESPMGTRYHVYTYPEGSGGGAVTGEGSGPDLERSSREDDSLQARVALPVPPWKRAIDIVGSAAGIALLAPLFGILAIYIKLVSPGPVFFRQQRVGHKASVFRCFKLRTMHVRSNNSEVHREYFKELMRTNRPMAKLDDQKDARLIRGAKLLRKAGIDELPQLLNVLKGEMTLVGPRPCIPYEAAEYLRWHAERFDVPPGLTGLWQVSGKNDLPFETMVRLDIRYAKEMSFWTDVGIVLRTFPAILGIVFGPLMHGSRVESERTDIAHAPH